jgi:hypothetical protein
MKRRELTLHAGGLYRCCAQTFEEWVAEAPEADAADGEKITCRFEPKSMPAAQMIVSGRTVSWLDPDYPPIPKAKP